MMKHVYVLLLWSILPWRESTVFNCLSQTFHCGHLVAMPSCKRAFHCLSVGEFRFLFYYQELYMVWRNVWKTICRKILPYSICLSSMWIWHIIFVFAKFEWFCTYIRIFTCVIFFLQELDTVLLPMLPFVDAFHF